MKEINPQETTRAYAFEMWMKAPMPMVTIFKTLDVSRLVRMSRRKGMKFNMLMCYCIGKAASDIKEFYLLPVGNQLMQFDKIAINTMVKNHTGDVSSCDIAFDGDFNTYCNDYMKYTTEVAQTCIDRDLSKECMVIGTSAIVHTELEFAGGMYSGIYNNPYIIWGKYRRCWFKTTLMLSFQFHHAQMDGVHAAHFLNTLQEEINKLRC